jgi:Flp pilus assembly protein CpaB
MDVGVARRLERPSWINARAALGLVLLCTSLVAGRQLIESSTSTVPVWAAERDLATGAHLDPSALTRIEVAIPSPALNRYLSATGSPAGLRVGRPIARGELIPVAALSEEAADGRGSAMTIPVSPEHALGGELRPGDHIDVFATFNSQDLRARTTLLVSEVEVLDLVSSGGLVLDGEAVVGVTVALSPDEAAKVAFAVRTAEIDIVRLETGARHATGSIGPRDFR